MAEWSWVTLSCLKWEMRAFFREWLWGLSETRMYEWALVMAHPNVFILWSWLFNKFSKHALATLVHKASFHTLLGRGAIRMEGCEWVQWSPYSLGVEAGKELDLTHEMANCFGLTTQYYLWYQAKWNKYNWKWRREWFSLTGKIMECFHEEMTFDWALKDALDCNQLQSKEKGLAS